jgi:hypothetical protein
LGARLAGFSASGKLRLRAPYKGERRTTLAHICDDELQKGMLHYGAARIKPRNQQVGTTSALVIRAYEIRVCLTPTT